MEVQYSGTIENATPEQKKIKDEIKKWVLQEKNLNPNKWNDWYVLRFCRARKFDVEKIKIMIENYIKWSKEVDLEAIGNLDIKQYEPIKEVTCHGYCNIDKLGRPIFIEDVKALKAKKIFKIFEDKQLILYYVQSYERLLHLLFPECSRVMGKRVDRTMTIMNLKKVSIIKLFGGKVRGFLKLATSITQDYYPEIMGKMYIVNAGYFFSGIWAIVKPWLDPVVQKKIFIESGSGKKNLFKDIDEDMLHVSLGGKFDKPIQENHGPWKEILDKSYVTKKTHHPDQALIKKYFLSPEEKS